MNGFMTVPEIARHLRVSARKVYDLVERGGIPHLRAGARLLFDTAQVDAWLLRRGSVDAPTTRPAADTAAPPVIAGSHDPLLEWAVRASGCALAMLTRGSRDGLHRMQALDACAAAIHLPSPDLSRFNVDEVASRFAGRPVVLVTWAWREQGLIVPPGNPRRIEGVGDLLRRGVRTARRQAGAGSRELLDRLVAREIERRRRPAWQPALDELADEDEAALAVAHERADCAMGIRAVAERHGLSFVPLLRERVDLLVDRRSWFEPPWQQLMKFCAGRSFRERARLMGGYDVGALGEVVWNG